MTPGSTRSDSRISSRTGGEERFAALGLEHYLRHVDARGFLFGERRPANGSASAAGAELG